ncbi:MAG TPA: VOC family protein [Jatrophihabitans sp.]
MRQSVQVVTVGVTDLDVSRDFYTHGLGWIPTLDLPDIVFYQVGAGLVFAIFGILDLAADIGVAVTVGGGFSLGQVVTSQDEVDSAMERARAAGAEILKEPQYGAFGGYHGYFADPDGHRWEVAWNPGFTVADDGTVKIRLIT